MVSARTWAVRYGGQQVDLGLVSGYQAPVPLRSISLDNRSLEPIVARDSAQASTTPPGIPLTFMENVGQFDERVKFQVRSGNTTLILTQDALWASLSRNSSKPDPGLGVPMSDAVDHDPEAAHGVNLRLSFPGANPHPHIEPFYRLDTKVSFFTGSDPAQWYADVPVWSGVRYVDLYPGIDLEITSQNGQLVQRLIVQDIHTAVQGASHSSPLSDLRLRVEGADNLS